MTKNISRDIRDFSEFLPISTTVVQILAAKLKGKSANEQLIRHVESDNALTAMVLRAANSSFYGFRGQIVSVSHAVIVIGYEEISRIVLMHEMRQRLLTLSSNQNKYINQLWRHSIASATIARLLTKVVRYNSNGEEFTGGLLHDLGKLVIVQHYPAVTEGTIAAVKQGSGNDIDAEKSQLSLSHDEIGGILGKQWGLPTLLIETMSLHHTLPGSMKYPLVVALVRFADLISEQWGYGIGEQSNGMTIENDPCWSILQKNYQSFADSTVAAIEATLQREFESHKEFTELFIE